MVSQVGGMIVLGVMLNENGVNLFKCEVIGQKKRIFA